MKSSVVLNHLRELLKNDVGKKYVIASIQLVNLWFDDLVKHHPEEASHPAVIQLRKKLNKISRLRKFVVPAASISLTAVESASLIPICMNVARDLGLSENKMLLCFVLAVILVYALRLYREVDFDLKPKPLALRVLLNWIWGLSVFALLLGLVVVCARVTALLEGKEISNREIGEAIRTHLKRKFVWPLMPILVLDLLTHIIIDAIDQRLYTSIINDIIGEKSL